VTIEALPGHTPGHSGYLIQSGGEALLVWGDAVHVPGVQFPRPDVGIGFDTDGAAAQASRKRIFAKAAADRLLVAGMHLEFPCFGHVTAEAAGAYAFHPLVWEP
jgi:glyoxylase-like metal-dependent hydrolase (beta-lactamase superfamily II)